MRLIDADKIIGCAKYIKINENFEPYITIDDLAKLLDEQPTAYSVDKIVEELEKMKGLVCCGKSCRECKYISDCVDGEQSEKVAIDKAIEIVKQGGVADDVCEWRLCDEEANVYDTSCRNPYILIEGTPQENNYKYCPYCGKKIKVIQNDN